MNGQEGTFFGQKFNYIHFSVENNVELDWFFPQLSTHTNCLTQHLLIPVCDCVLVCMGGWVYVGVDC